VRQFSSVLDEVLSVVSGAFPFVLALMLLAVLLRSWWFGFGLAIRVSLVDAVLLYSSVLVLYLVASPQPGVRTSLKWVPGTDLLSAVQAAPGDVWPWLQLTGNLGLLFPLGALLPLRTPWLTSFRGLALAAFALTCTIETLQCTVMIGRVASADDVVLNTGGALLGGLFSRPWWGELCGLPRPVPSRLWARERAVSR
jgi:glycopeptide antibiotics resistance protein